ncbi:MAG: hypothetical protein MUF31_15435 [Akkermansiaceae bacterium]|jgi:hypothetical protein|nr:hypothetical protein [Akkermansiaceae bacterium]
MSQLQATLRDLRKKATAASNEGELLTAFLLNSALDDIENAIAADKHAAALAAVTRKHRQTARKLGLRLSR